MSPRRSYGRHRPGVLEEGVGVRPLSVALSPPPSPASSGSSSGLGEVERVSCFRREAASEGHTKRGTARMSLKRETRRIPPFSGRHQRAFSRSRARDLGSSNECRPSSITRCGHEDSGDLFVTTLDEDDQQMFIALFYWRRKVIETHFLAWKWVVCTLRRSAKGVRRQTLGRRAGGAVRTRLDPLIQPSSRQNLILKRSVGRLSAAEEDKLHTGAIDNEFMKSFSRRDKIIGSRAKSADQSPKDTPKLPVEAYSSGKRRQFRQQLRLVYSCFAQWKERVEELRGRTQRLLAKCGELRRRRQLKRVLQVWRREQIRQDYKELRLREAHGFHLHRVILNAFRGWEMHWRINCEISRRQQLKGVQQKQRRLLHWRQCVLQTTKCRAFAGRRRRNQLKHVFHRFQECVAQETANREREAFATSHYEDSLQALMFHVWKRAVICSALHLLSIEHGKRIASSTGVRRWKRFVAKRQTRACKELLADYSRYRWSLRSTYEAWCQFRQSKQQRKRCRDAAQRQHEVSLKRSAIRRLHCAVCAQQTQKRRTNDVIRWQRHKRLSRVFTAWARDAQLNALTDRFHAAVQVRKLAKAVRTWQMQSMNTRELLAKRVLISKCHNLSLMRSCMATWTRKRQLKESTSRFQRRRESALAAYHFGAWSSLTKKRQSQREAIQKLRLKKERAVLHSVMGQWCGVTMRKRCFRRLVKLFRKKHTRVRVKFIFHLLRAHGHACKLHRQMNCDRVRSSFRVWKQFSRHRSEDTAAMTVATQYYSLRRYVLALKRWSSFVASEVETRDLDAVAVSHYFRRLLRSSLQSWYVAVQRCRRQNEFLVSRLRMLGKQVMSRCMDFWRAYVQQRMEHKAKEWAALRFQVASHQRRAFDGWQVYLQLSIHSKEMAAVATSAHAECLCTKVLRTWRLAARREARLKTQFSLAVNTLTTRRIQASIRNWNSFQHERRRRRENTSQAIRFHSEFLLCLALFRWQEVWFKRSAVRNKEVNATKRAISLRVEKAVRKWRQHHAHALRIRSQEERAKLSYSTRLLRALFQGWKHYHEAVRREVNRRRQAALRLQQRVLAWVFKAWRYFSIQHRIMRCQRQAAFRQRDSFMLRSSFTLWRRHRSERTLEKCAVKFRTRQLLKKMVRSWEAHCAFVKKMSHHLMVTRQLLRHNMYRSTFVRWKMYVTYRHEHLRSLIRAEDYHIQKQCVKAVNRMTKLTKFKRAAAQARALLCVNLSTRCLSQWKQYAGHKRERRAQRESAEHHHSRRSQQTHFTAWKLLTRRHTQEKKNTGDALYHTACLRMTWSRWHRVVGWRKNTHTMGEWRVSQDQRTALCRWKAHTLASIEYKAASSRAVAFRRLTLQRRVWKYWQRHISLCHEKQERLAWVFGYYCVDVLQRRCLGSWKQLLLDRRDKAENKRLAAVFNQCRIAREGYHRWREYLAIRRSKLELRESQLCIATSMVLARSVRKWRSRIGMWRKQHKCEEQASVFYQNRRLDEGMRCLLNWKQTCEKSRRLTAKAVDFRCLQLMRACFRRWQRYHKWRARYEHLRRLLKHNQKDDVFARWKKYWQKLQHADKMRLRARIFHCVHAEQRSLAAWRLFVRLKKQNQRACAFDALRTLGLCFQLWRQKILVVQRMRKLFLYQDSFRQENHFAAWKRYCTARTQLNSRLRDAMKFRDDLRKQDAWEMWRSWVHAKKQEREVIQLAIGFRERFSSRKSFARWESRVGGWKRKRSLEMQAVHCVRSTLLWKTWQALNGWRLEKMELRRRREQFTVQLEEKRKRQVVDTLRRRCLENERLKAQTRRANAHWASRHQQWCWRQLLAWYNAAKTSKAKFAKAVAISRVRSLQNSLAALKACTAYSRRIEAKISTFRLRYFRNMVDDCFYQWRAFATFKVKLRALACKATLSRRQRRFQQWRAIASELARRREGMLLISARRRKKTLTMWLNHWESVCTDRWLERELLAHHRRHAQRRRMTCSAVRRWKAQLTARRERQQWRTFSLARHSTWLTDVLQQWRSAVGCDGHCERV